MFKKIEIWILYLVILFSLLFAIGFGTLVRQEIEGTTKKGGIDISFLSKPAAYIARLPEQFVRLIIQSNPNRINHFWDDYREFYNQNGFGGIPNSDESYLLLSRYDGDLKEGLVELVDLTSFQVLHTWNPDIDRFNDSVEKVGDFKYLDRDNNNSRGRILHPKLTQDGGLLFHNGTPLRKINACSDLVFQNTHDIFHHSIETDIDGNIWSSTHMYPQSLPIEQFGRDIPEDGGYYDDAIVKLSQDGEILYEKSISEIFIDNGMESRLSMVGTSHEFQEDPIHINDVQPVNYDSKYWKKGDVFISLGHQSMVILFRPSTEEIIWKYDYNIFHQHDVDIINEEEVSIFNNNHKYFYQDRDVVDGHNEVLIYNFKTKNVTSYLHKSLVREDVRTGSQGRGEILANGDLFVEETDFARILYFNSDGTLRWTHVNRANNKNVYTVGWSRILYKERDVIAVKNFLTNKRTCNE